MINARESIDREGSSFAELSLMKDDEEFLNFKRTQEPSTLLPEIRENSALGPNGELVDKSRHQEEENDLDEDTINEVRRNSQKSKVETF